MCRGKKRQLHNFYRRHRYSGEQLSVDVLKADSLEPALEPVLSGPIDLICQINKLQEGKPWLKPHIRVPNLFVSIGSR